MRVLSKWRAVRMLPAPQLVRPVTCHVRLCATESLNPLTAQPMTGTQRDTRRSTLVDARCMRLRKRQTSQFSSENEERRGQFTQLQGCAISAPTDSDAHAIADDRGQPQPRPRARLYVNRRAQCYGRQGTSTYSHDCCVSFPTSVPDESPLLLGRRLRWQYKAQHRRDLGFLILSGWLFQCSPTSHSTLPAYV